jgi:hypothetical protein
MKRTIRVILALGLVWMLMGAPEALLAARKQGAQVRMTLTNNEAVQGEVIGIRGETIVLLTSQGDRSIGINEVATVLIKDRSGMMIGGAIGLTAGVIVDASIWHSYKSDTSNSETLRVLLVPGALLIMLLVACGGAGGGMLIGNAAHKGKTYKIKGMTPEEIRGLMETLRKKALVPDYK